MTEEQAAPPAEPAAEAQRPEAVISAQSAMRVLLALLAVWTLFSALALIFFQEGSAATIGGGLEGDEGAAAKRLLGVHLLVLAPLYGLIAWDPKRYRYFLWVPYVAQGGVVIVTLFDVITGSRDFWSGALPLVVASVFLVLLLYVWRAGKVPEAPEEHAAPGAAPAELAPPAEGAGERSPDE